MIDTGIGIAPEHIDRIWSPFERFAAKTSNGSGLGLTITRLLVDILGGEITVESAVGQGTTFAVRLLLPAARGDYSTELAQTPALQTLSTCYEGPRKRVLVIDDDSDHLGLLEAVLAAQGFLVQSAPDGESALSMLDIFHPDLFVLDIDMPGMTGWDVARKLRGLPAFCGTPIVMVTAHALEARRPLDHKPLYDAFIVKPYSLNDFLFRAAMLMQVQLVAQQTTTPDTTATTSTPMQPIPPDLLKRAIERAEGGHAAGVQRDLDTLESTGAIAPTALAEIRCRLAEFDMPSVSRLLQEMSRDDA